MAKSKTRKSRSNSSKLALWQIGLFLILAGVLAYAFSELVWPLKPPLTNEQRGQAFGRGLASALFVIAGVVVFVMHFVRRRRR